MKNFKKMKDYEIVEKHLALSIMNNERKNLMQNYNDKYRAKLAKERINIQEERGNEKAFDVVKK